MNNFLVWCPSLGEDGPNDGRKIVADCMSDAAEAWARWNDHHSADYRIVGGEVYEVRVQAATGHTETFFVSGESVPVYRARLKVARAIGDKTDE